MSKFDDSLADNTEKIGMFHLADDLSKETGDQRIKWLHRIAAAVSGMPGSDVKIFKLDYFDLRKNIESRGIEAVKALAEQKQFTEPENIEQLLRTICFEPDQVAAFRREYASEQKQNIQNIQNTEEFYKDEAKKLLSENDGNKNIAIYLLIKKYGQKGTEKNKPYLQACSAGVMVRISGYPDNWDDKIEKKKYWDRVSRCRKQGKKLLNK